MKKNFARWIVPVVLTALVVTGLYFLLSGTSGKTLTAYFPRTVSLYKGSDVRILGVKVGAVDSVTPDGAQVKVVMHYDTKIKVPADAKAVIVAPAVVGDRFVQLAWDHPDTSGPMADNAVLQLTQTSAPLELDTIFNNIDTLVKAVGPNGANSNGALNDLLKQTAANFQGQGAQFNQTLNDLGGFTQTLDDNKSKFFDSAQKLEGFTHTLATNDGTVRQFTADLANISTLLADERGDLGNSLKNLATAMSQVKDFVAKNKDSLGTTIKSLNGVLGVVVHQRDALSEILKAAPNALNNVFLVYNPDVGALNANAHLDQAVAGVSAPTATLCTLVSANDPTGAICTAIKALNLPRAAFGQGTATTMDLTLGGLVQVTR
ncbi:MCE family protein [Nocardioides baekrokdamisoli]|nr:MCE family protein [Nocardioides baekrokdamisoli]